MGATRIEEITTDEGWDRAVPILRELWSDADEPFVRSWRQEDDYRLFGRYELGNSSASSASRSSACSTTPATPGSTTSSSRSRGGARAPARRCCRSSNRGRANGTASTSRSRTGWGTRGRFDFYEAEGLEPWGYVVETAL